MGAQMLIGLDKFEDVIDPKEGKCGARADFGESTLCCFGTISGKIRNSFGLSVVETNLEPKRPKNRDCDLCNQRCWLTRGHPK